MKERRSVQLSSRVTSPLDDAFRSFSDGVPSEISRLSLAKSRSRRRSGAEHAGHLLSRQPAGRSLRVDAGHAVNGSWLAHERAVEACGDPSNDGAVLAGEVALRDGHGRGSPDVLRGIREVARNLGGAASGRATERRGGYGDASGSADGGETGKAGGEAWATAGLLSHDDLVEESDGGIRCGLSFSVMDELVESWKK